MTDIQNMASHLLASFKSPSTSELFVSNGLLDARRALSPAMDALNALSTQKRQEKPPEDLLIEDTEQTLVSDADMWSTDGLLGDGNSKTSVSAQNDIDKLAKTADFSVTNGLLGSGKNSSRSSFRSSAASSDFSKTNGLLGSGGSTSQSSLADLAEETLPSISDLLGAPVRQASTSYNAPSSLSPICASTYNGKSVYLMKKVRKHVVKPTFENKGVSSLLEVPIHRLMDQINTVAIAKLDQPVAGPSRLNSSSTQPIETDLWVDRYRPKRFTELLGDERVHRETLSWLKEWDWCVFGKRKLPGKGMKKPADSEYRNDDEYKRPKEKLLLLSGPPGLGKTTLAHIVARQAGYEVMEINASDARSGQIIEDRIRPALESGSKVGSKKPICMVIDEIDGATGAGDNSGSFVQKLVSLTFDKPYKKPRPGEKKDNKGKRPLLRPIICICNDLYASSLAKLRPHARIIRFNRPADIHLVKRLRDICDLEGLRADSRALTSLVGLAKGDLRGCLNTLQFIKAKNQEVTESVVRVAAAGIKEADATFNSLMSSLFAPLPKKRVKELGMTEEEEGRYVSRLSKELEASGSMDKIALGCFEHYTSLKQFDATLGRFEKAASWLLTFDVLSGSMRSEREYAIMPYLSYTIVPFHPLFQERGGGRVERPKADWENYMQTKTNEEIYKSLASSVRNASATNRGLRHVLANQIIQLELAPYLNRMISPPLRPVNSQVIKQAEKVTLERLVEIMVSLELRFVQDKTEEGHLVYRLEPPIDVFITYDGKRATDIPVPRYATRHIVAAKVDEKMIVRQADAVERTSVKVKNSSFFKSKAEGPISVPGDAALEETEEIEGGGELLGASAKAGHLSSKKRKSDALLDPADKPPVDFFGRPLTVEAANKAQHKMPKLSHSGSMNAGNPKLQTYRVSYRYNEGNSAAVRKPIKVSAFV